MTKRAAARRMGLSLERTVPPAFGALLAILLAVGATFYFTLGPR